MALFEKAGAKLDWYILEGQGHGLRLSSERERKYAQFIFGTVRDPLPDDLSWATEDTAYYGRRSWLVIEKLGKSTKADASNILPRFGTPLQLKGPTQPHVPWGRVKLHRQGNRVRATTTTNVERFTLLI
jgi:hypothetical protein